MLDTRTEESIYNSLADILKVRKEKVELFFSHNMPEFLGKGYWEIDLDIFYKYFNLEKESFQIDSVTIHHVTTRLNSEGVLEQLEIENLETVLLSDNSLTQLCKKYGVRFEKEEGIAVYCEGIRKEFKNPLEARLRSRLDNLRDSCVNGFLFPEMMNNCYIGLTGMPEIFSDLMGALNKKEAQYEYFKNKKCFLATIKVNISELIFDGSKPDLILQEKTEQLLRYIIGYVYYKILSDDGYMSNPIIRLPDNKCVPHDEILSIREIFDYKEIFDC